MWALGCVFFEMLQVMYPSDLAIKDGILRPILFMGDQCYPLTGNTQQSDLSQDDMIRVIIRELPKLDETDLCFIDKSDNRQYVEIVQRIEERQQSDKEACYNYLDKLDGAPEDMLTILTNLL